MPVSKSFVDQRLADVERTPRMWGSNAEIESMVITLLECEFEGQDILWVYVETVRRVFGTNRPLHRTFDNDKSFLDALFEVAKRVRDDVNHNALSGPV